MCGPQLSVNDRLCFTRGPGMPGPYKATEEIHYAFNRRTRQIIRHRLAAVFCAGARKAVLCRAGRLCDGGCGGKDRLPRTGEYLCGVPRLPGCGGAGGHSGGRTHHEPGQAMGLSFSVPDGCKGPPSLRNIFKELESEFGPGSAAHTDLTPWARQGVLLLNTVLTVEQGAANAHAGHGWETFTRAALEYAAAQGTARWPLCCGASLRRNTHRFLTPLPPAARCWYWNPPTPARFRPTAGSLARHRSAKVNELLKNNDSAEIDWCLPANATHS